MIHRATQLRLLTVSVLLAIYGALGVLGYGLHDLLHAHHNVDADLNDVGHVCCVGHGHAHDDISQEIRTASSSPAKSGGKAAQGVEDECALCLFLTQAQQPTFKDTTKSFVVISPTHRSAEELIHPLNVPELSLARGPPC